MSEELRRLLLVAKKFSMRSDLNFNFALDLERDQ